MATGITTLIIFIAIIGIAIVGYFLSKIMRRTKPDIPPNSPLVINFDPNKSNGFCIGVLKKKDGGQWSDRFTLTIRPLDVPYDQHGDPIESEDVKMAVRKEKVSLLPTGALSFNRDIIVIFPDKATDLDERFRTSALGTALAKATEIMDYKDQAVDMVTKTYRATRNENANLEREKDKIHELWKKNTQQGMLEKSKKEE